MVCCVVMDTSATVVVINMDKLKSRFASHISNTIGNNFLHKMAFSDVLIFTAIDMSYTLSQSF